MAAQKVAISGNLPTVRLRQGVKLASAANEAHLRGMAVDWPVVFSNLASICSGAASMSQLPSTVCCLFASMHDIGRREKAIKLVPIVICTGAGGGGAGRNPCGNPVP